MSDPDCLFCRIIAGDEQAEVILDVPDAMAFLDVRPVFPGHTLLVPRAHYETLNDLPPELIGPFFATVQRVADAVEKGMNAHGTFVAANNRVSQSVLHFHMHVVPRRRKDGLRGFFWPRNKYGSDVEQAEVASRIRAALQPGTLP